MSHPARCRRCDRQLETRPVARLGSRVVSYSTDRPPVARQAVVRHAGRGLCETCYAAAGLDGTVHDYPLVRTGIDPDEFTQLAEFGLDDARMAGHFGVSIAAIRKHRSRKKTVDR